jgi:hypothetical protein
MLLDGKKSYLLQHKDLYQYYMTQEEKDLFNRAFAKRGGLLDIESHPYMHPTNKEILGNIISQLRGNLIYVLEPFHIKPKILIGYLDLSVIGAVATKIDDTYLIGLHAGTIPVFNCFFARLLSSPRLFPEVGDISKIKLAKTENPHMLSAEYALDEQSKDNLYESIGEERSALSFRLGFYAIRHLIKHEIAHIMNGHLEFLKNHGNNSKDFEDLIIPPPHDDSNRMIDQALEFDADTTATMFDIREMYDTIKHKGKITAQYESIADYYKEWLFSIVALYRLMGLREYNKENLLSYTHPPVGMRNVYINVKAMRFLSSPLYADIIDENFKSNLDEYYKNILLQVEDGFEDINLYRARAADSADSTAAFAYFNVDHISKIEDKFHEILPTLRQYSYKYNSE